MDTGGYRMARRPDSLALKSGSSAGQLWVIWEVGCTPPPPPGLWGSAQLARARAGSALPPHDCPLGVGWSLEAAAPRPSTSPPRAPAWLPGGRTTVQGCHLPASRVYSSASGPIPGQRAEGGGKLRLPSLPQRTPMAPLGPESVPPKGAGCGGAAGRLGEVAGDCGLRPWVMGACPCSSGCFGAINCKFMSVPT